MDQVAQIREKIDIIAYLSEFITLKKAGRNFKAVCPFHNEKSPSFMVSPERQSWHCFGCGKGGDVYSFLMEYEHVEFPEALRILAKKAGIELVQSKYEAGVSSRKEKLYSINSLAAEYYHYILTSHKVGENALAYLKERGLSEKIIKTFHLGFSPSGGAALSSYLLKKKKYELDDFVEAGLGFPRGRDAVDFFKGRLMFPLVDHRENVVGFAGRVMEKDVNTAKYINTRDTLVYHKGEQFYGLNVTKDAIRKEGHAILVEGEFDVISSFQEGISNVVAVKGTALTEAQVSLIGRYAPKISMCFDGDKAGQEAIKRSLPIIEKKGLQVTIITLPDGKDPDDAVRTNPLGYKMAIKKDVSVYDFLYTKALESGDRESAEGKKAIADAFLPTIASMTNEIIREHYLRKLSDVLETTYESVVKELGRLAIKKVEGMVKVPEVSKTRTREEILEEYLISLILQSPSPRDAMDKVLQGLVDSGSQERAYRKILTHMAEYFQQHNEFDAKVFSERLPTELHQVYNTSILFPLPDLKDAKSYQAEIEKTTKELRDVYLRERIKKVSEELKKAEKDNNEEETLRLGDEQVRLVGLLHSS